MNFRGERFHIPLDDHADDEYDAFEQSATHKSAAPDAAASSLASLVKDIQERSPASSAPPVAPTPKCASHGFPAHKKRHGVSKFKQARVHQGHMVAGSAAPLPEVANEESSFQEREWAAIDKANKERLAAMSDESIAKEREELLKALSPSLVERLMRRANIEVDTGPDHFPQPAMAKLHAPSTNPESDDTLSSDTLQSTDREQGDLSRKEQQVMIQSLPLDTVRNELQHSAAKESNELSSDYAMHAAADSIHFPRPPAAPQLDISSPSFLADLHSKYFPSLPSDPSKLAWMTDPTTIESYESSYSPEAESVPTSALRFSFRGILIPPRSALSIPVTDGLHHHGDAPESAGYTISELAHLARSSFPAQRCVAFQTLGRIMFRLGKGEYGNENSDVANGLWKCIEQGRVLETLQANAGRIGGHMSSKAYATEALWLWQKGGGQRVKAS